MTKPYHRIIVELSDMGRIIATLYVYGLTREEAAQVPNWPERFRARGIHEEGILTIKEVTHYLPPRSTPHVYVTPKAYEFV
ncbi:MAG: hypothetical protein ACKO0Z_07060 [Betaproteobacteria bacterium]